MSYGSKSCPWEIFGWPCLCTTQNSDLNWPKCSFYYYFFFCILISKIISFSLIISGKMQILTLACYPIFVKSICLFTAAGLWYLVQGAEGVLTPLYYTCRYVVEGVNTPSAPCIHVMTNLLLSWNNRNSTEISVWYHAALLVGGSS